MLAELLETAGYEAVTAHDGDEGLERFREKQPDLVVLDVMMPRRDGIATLVTLREQSQVPVIMLTAMGEQSDRILGLETGADDYLAKPFAPRELLLRIAAILRRHVPEEESASSDVIEIGPLTVRPGRHEARLGGEELTLTGAEMRILAELALRHGDVVSRERLTRHALGRALTPLDRALDTHMSHLRRKLGAVARDDQRCEIRSVRGAGYRLIID
ncbi:MAG: response regulator transcription factor [Gammaproteobacteria bacterium]|nr:response regulator transcription factor [Gammaproteobacteria bacterium]